MHWRLRDLSDLFCFLSLSMQLVAPTILAEAFPHCGVPRHWRHSSKETLPLWHVLVKYTGMVHGGASDLRGIRVISGEAPAGPRLDAIEKVGKNAPVLGGVSEKVKA